MGRPPGSKNKNNKTATIEPPKKTVKKTINKIEVAKPEVVQAASGPSYLPVDMRHVFNEHALLRTMTSFYGYISPEVANRLIREASVLDENPKVYLLKKVMAFLKIPQSEIERIMEEIKKYNPSKLTQLYTKIKNT
jgi:hypothetical protein